MEAKRKGIRDTQAKAHDGTCTEIFKTRLLNNAAKEQKVVNMDEVRRCGGWGGMEIWEQFGVTSV